MLDLIPFLRQLVITFNSLRIILIITRILMKKRYFNKPIATLPSLSLEHDPVQLPQHLDLLCFVVHTRSRPFDLLYSVQSNSAMSSTRCAPIRPLERWQFSEEREKRPMCMRICSAMISPHRLSIRGADVVHICMVGARAREVS